MIPKKIHYCWFGRGQMPELALRCLESWKKFCPDYEIKEWNEDNFDLEMYPYAREAYENCKFAFVTDVVRMYVLYHEGGIYMDTDVEVLKPLDCFLDNPAFAGFEDDVFVGTAIIASEKKGNWVKDNLDYYVDKHFVKDNGDMDFTTNVETILNYLLPLGLIQNDTYQVFSEIVTIYPKEYFCPKSKSDNKIYLTDNTYTIHHFAASWTSPTHRFLRKLVIFIGGYRLKNFMSYLKKKLKW